MSERAAYSRVYWSIIDDEKFANVYDDDRALAAWMRLLLVADQAWPASAHLPANTRRQAVAVLVGAGLVDLQPGGRYRIHGLDAERERRKAAATRPPGRGDPTGTQPGPRGGGNTGPKTRRDETSQDEDFARAPVTEAIDYIEERTGRMYSFGAGSKVHDTLSADIRDFGLMPILAAMKADTTAHPDIGQLVFGASRLLHPISTPDPKAAAKAERDADEKRASDARFAATQRLIQEQERRRGDA